MAEFNPDERLVRHPRDYTPTPNAEKVLEFIHLFGGMSTTPIIQKWRELTGLYKQKENASEKSAPHQSLKTLLRDLFNGGYIDRPKTQMNFYRPRRFPLVHRVSLKGEDYLKSKRLFSAHAPKPWGTYEHNMLTACIYQGYYLNALEAGFSFEPQHTFVPAHGGTPSFTINERKVTSDVLFSLGIKDKNILIFLEIDRGTEVGSTKNQDRKSYGRSAEEYYEFIGRGSAIEKLYKSHFKLAPTHGAQVHFVTTSVSAQLRMLGQVARIHNKECPYFLATTCLETGEETHAIGYIPMLDTEWNRHGMGPFVFPKGG